MDLGLETQKANVGVRISILEILWVPIFGQNGKLRLFRSKFSQKWIFRLEFQTAMSRFGISASKVPYVPLFSQNGNYDSFGLNLGNLANYVWYFGFYNVEDVAESRVEAEMS